MERDLGDDRKWQHEFVLRLGTVVNGIDELLKSQHGQAARIADKVEDAVEPVLEEAKGLKNIIKKKKMIAFKPKFHFLFWRR